MESSEPPKLSEDQKQKWAGLLFQKLAFVERTSREIGQPLTAAKQEVDRQIKQVINESTITKSGGDDE